MFAIPCCCVEGPKGYLCTQPKGHTNDHIARGPDGTPYEVWPSAREARFAPIAKNMRPLTLGGEQVFEDRAFLPPKTLGDTVRLPDMRIFEMGATRDGDADKFDYEGFLSPRVLERYARYMHKHRQQADGKLRDSDNWQKGIPRSAYMKSAWRHFMDVWTRWRSGNFDVPETEEALCALLFNVMGLLHETVVPPVTAKDEFERAADAIAKIPESEMAIFPERHTAP